MSLVLATAVALAPDVLFVDRTLDALDHRERSRFAQMLRQHCDRGHAVVVGTGDQHLLTELCHTAIWLEGGKVVASGWPHVVGQRYQEHREQTGRVAIRRPLASTTNEENAAVWIAGSSVHTVDRNDATAIASNFDSEVSLLLASRVPKVHGRIAVELRKDGAIARQFKQLRIPELERPGYFRLSVNLPAHTLSEGCYTVALRGELVTGDVHISLAEPSLLEFSVLGVDTTSSNGDVGADAATLTWQPIEAPRPIQRDSEIAEGSVHDDATLLPALPEPTHGLRQTFAALWRARGEALPVAFQIAVLKYQQTILGWAWLVLRPLIPALIMWSTFGILLQAPTDDIPYPIFFLVGNSLWLLFSQTIYFCTRGLRWTSRLMAQQDRQGPPVLYLFAMSSYPLSDLAINLGIAIIIAIVYWVTSGTFYLDITPRLLAIPPIVLLTLCFGLAIACWTSILDMIARDVRFVLRYVIYFWAFITPVFYATSVVEQKPALIGWIIRANPMTPLVVAYRWSVFGSPPPNLVHFTATSLCIFLYLCWSIVFFTRAYEIVIENSLALTPDADDDGGVLPV